jgi:REP element-mobilizing transposase RayT
VPALAMTKYDPNLHHRRSIRLEAFDYAQSGAYYVTIVVQNRDALLGSIGNEAVALTDAGQMVAYWWNELTNHFRRVTTDAFIVMPNHVHGIIVIKEGEGGHTGPPLPTIVGWFKTMTTNACIRGVHEHGWEPFAGRFWQRGYYERVIRSDDELAKTREYIESNPLRWEEDEENPAKRTSPP